ncbi:MAG TPA: DUF6617 family protein [Prolixibacteraceae bacterium]|nr:DUF6617 family protein [Prolixibacteraceae bacterium]
MKNHFYKLDEILYKSLRPWLHENNPDEKFASMISGIKDIEPTFQSKYQVKFERPFNNKTKYYSKFILAEKIKTINGLMDALHEDENPQLIKYRLNDTLNKKLKTKIKDIGKIIKDQQFEPTYIDPKKTTFDVDQEHKTNTFVFQLLKTSLIHIYLEVQEVYKDWIQDEFVIDDFYSQLLFEPVPDTTYIKEIEIIEITSDKETESAKTDVVFSLQSFTYNDYPKNSEKLTDLCDSLKKSGFIHKDTTTINFKKVFSGKEINTPIIWTGNPSEFAYFIKLIYTINHYVDNLKQRQWEVACKCFVQTDGSSFDRTKLRTLKKPQLTHKKLELAVDNLK